jgi:hypothetical protein
MQKELEKIVEWVFSFNINEAAYNDFRSLVTPMFNDSHPRVRYAACQCVLVV